MHLIIFLSDPSGVVELISSLDMLAMDEDGGKDLTLLQWKHPDRLADVVAWSRELWYDLDILPCDKANSKARHTLHQTRQQISHSITRSPPEPLETLGVLRLLIELIHGGDTLARNCVRFDK